MAAKSGAISIPSDMLLDHWQGHRRVTRRVIVAFPEQQLFHYSIGGMRPFSAMALEMISMASAGIRGIATRTWETTKQLRHHSGAAPPSTGDELLRLWDETTAEIDHYWPQIPPARFGEVDTAFGEYRRRPARRAALLDRQRDPSPRAGLCLSALVGDRAACLL